jgi:hypothetical protein
LGDDFCAFGAFYGVFSPFSGDFHVLGIMRIIAVDDWHVILASCLNKPLKVWDYTLGSFGFQFSSDKIVEHVNNYNCCFVFQKMSPSKRIMAQTGILTLSNY